ncbi:hypothetical protein KCP75_24900 [Salmonella enterica subsp. enterica]|nr:hypothetical protein KCP75_24900 [Salmonella enterica subsp. enterica]
MDAVGPDVFKLTILNAKQRQEEHVVGEETVRNALRWRRRYYLTSGGE